MEDPEAVNSDPQTEGYSILIVADQGSTGGTLYHALLSGTDWNLQTSFLPSLSPTHSNLVISSKHISRLRSTNINVFVSSQSGAGLAETAFDNLLEPLLKLFKITFSLHKTSSKISHREFLSRIPFSLECENIIIIFGGDTITYDLLNALSCNRHLTSSHRIILCLIPCGTGNALATSLGTTSIPIGISKIFGISETSAVQPKLLPLMKITIQEGRCERVIWGAVVCSWGLHASLVADSDDPEMRRQYGAKRFEVAAERLLSPAPHIYHGMLRVQDSPGPNEHSYLLISHVSHLEPTFAIAPKQSPLSRTVTVVQIGPTTGEELMGVMWAVYDNSRHLRMEQVKVQAEVSDVTFEVHEGEERFRRICIDGDIIIVENGANIGVRMCEGIEIGGQTVSIHV